MMDMAEHLHKLGVVVGANLLRIGPHRYLAELRQDLATLGGKVQILLSEIEHKIQHEMQDAVVNDEAFAMYTTGSEHLAKEWGEMAQVVADVLAEHEAEVGHPDVEVLEHAEANTILEPVEDVEVAASDEDEPLVDVAKRQRR